VQVYVTNGTENSPAPYVLITNNPIILNVSDITFKLSNFVSFVGTSGFGVAGSSGSWRVWEHQGAVGSWFHLVHPDWAVVQDLVIDRVLMEHLIIRECRIKRIG
jgi:hypothetical protein